jgi:DNA polymerase-3 subunit delta
MKKISVSDVEKRIKSGDIKPIYYIVGKEKYFHDRIIKLLKKKLFTDPGSGSLNTNIFYGTENTLGEMISACMDYPMLSDRKLVVVKNFSKMKISDPDTLEKYIANPVKSTVLLISTDDAGRTKVFQTLNKKAVAVSCDPVKDQDLSNWIFRFYRARKVEIDRQACQFLVTQIGSDLLLIENEIQKIRSFKNDDSLITRDHLLKTSGTTKQISSFALQNTLAVKNLAESLKISKELIESGENITGIIAILFAFYRKVMIVLSLKSLGKDRSQISKETKMTDYQLKNIYSTAQKYSMGQMAKIIELLKKIDTDLKTSNISEKHAIYMLCFNICSI